MTGEQFATLLNDIIHKDGKKHFATIKANSEQSKHLETVTLKVKDQMIDIVNLRSEEYAKDSRVPLKAELGTPKEDAERRDLTINSMFYNINTQEIEDFTGKGLDDLKNGTIRTPLEPFQTFIDDPLRVLRTIRFANRF
jgi:tRNA nucleotidyltransferase (CCA-adding enzyme)